MGSIRVREGRYEANVRRKGYPTVTKTFTSREVAKRWIKSTGIAIHTTILNQDLWWHADPLARRTCIGEAARTIRFASNRGSPSPEH